MDDRSTLLNQLRIDHNDNVEVRAARWPWLVGIIAVSTGLSIVVWLLPWAPQEDAVPVTVTEPQSQPLLSTPTPPSSSGHASILDASGYVVPRRQATVSSKITGRVIEVRIEEGQYVEAEEIIARLDDSNATAALHQAEAQVEQARANYEAARVANENEQVIFARIEALLVRDVISAQDFDIARANRDAARTALDVAARVVAVAEADLLVAQRSLEDTVVRAPFAGIVTVKAAQEGEMVSPVSAGGGFTRTGIGTIVDMASLELEVDVGENFINRVQPDQPVMIRLNAYPEWSIPGSVVAIVPTADRARATVKVRVRLEESDERVLPEMGARVSFLPRGDGDFVPLADGDRMRVPDFRRE